MARHVAGCEQQFTPIAKQSALFHAGSSAYEAASRTVPALGHMSKPGTDLLVGAVIALAHLVEKFQGYFESDFRKFNSEFTQTVSGVLLEILCTFVFQTSHYENMFSYLLISSRYRVA